MFASPVCLLCAGAASVAYGSSRVIDTFFRPVGMVLAGAGLFLIASPAFADQYKVAADNARVDCTVAKNELTRISLVGDQIAAVTKVSTGGQFNDFSVVNEPIRGDVYVAIPETYAPKTISFFATSKKGYVYKFACSIAPIEAQQVFVTNPQMATAKAAEWENQTPVQDTAVRLIKAMATQGSVDGYEIRQPASSPAKVGDLSVRLIAEYRGASLKGKVLRIENRGTKPVVLREGDLAPQGTLAVTIGQPDLAPGQATAAYLVGQNGGDQ
ncbi:type-F conjugative transfer system secretin TraK [Sphingomonas sp. TZW2008]|uniref:type-F conjugative transfer system secretin TraK n=1 Tax=Sphingomonas sp. TZW2008 TaxID=1917973 RepID=UPI0015C5178C|nr:type-F conjugative transfer system secretin TraK [Sphingomonas sp. TZW2008]